MLRTIGIFEPRTDCSLFHFHLRWPAWNGKRKRCSFSAPLERNEHSEDPLRALKLQKKKTIAFPQTKHSKLRSTSNYNRFSFILSLCFKFSLEIIFSLIKFPPFSPGMLSTRASFRFNLLHAFFCLFSRFLDGNKLVSLPENLFSKTPLLTNL